MNKTRMLTIFSNLLLEVEDAGLITTRDNNNIMIFISSRIKDEAEQ